MDENHMHIYQFSTTPGCSPYRLEFPGECLNQLHGFQVTRFRIFDEKTFFSIIENGDMVIVQRLDMNPVAFKLFAELNRLGKLIIFEIDDNLIDMPPETRFSKYVGNEYSLHIKKSILACQAVQCSTSPLSKVISDFHPEVAVLENQLEKVPPFIDKDINDNNIIIGYAAGGEHLMDWQTIKEKYNQIISELESRSYKIQTWIIGDEIIFQSLTSANKKFFPILPRNDYMDVLSNLDVSLMPLADNHFNRCKSDIKFLESASSGAAVLASDVVYADTINHGENGLLFRNPEEFGGRLTELVKNPRLIETLTKNAHRYVSDNRIITQHIGKWEKTYRNWYGRRNELLRNTPGKIRD